MKVLVVATTSYAGMGPYVSEIVNTFSPYDDVYYFFHDYEDDFYRKNIKSELHAKSVFFRQANSALNKIVNLITNRSANESRILHVCKEKRIELVHYINGIPSLRMQRKFEKLEVKLLSTVHDLHTHEAKKVWYKMWRHHIMYKRLEKNLAGARYLVTNSTEQYNELKKLYPDRQIMFHSFPSLVTNEIKIGNAVPKELNAIHKPYILFFGRLEEYKGVRYLYEAFSEQKELYENYSLVIAGSGNIAMKRIPDEKERNILLLNRYIKDSEIASLYKNAICVVYPYVSATQTGVLSLAFFYKTPTLTSDIPYFNNVIESTGTGITFKSENKIDLQLKLMRLLEQDNSMMKENQYKYYQKYYRKEAIRQQLMNIYEMMI